MLTGGKSERTCHLACLSLLLENSHVWESGMSFDEVYVKNTCGGFYLLDN